MGFHPPIKQVSRNLSTLDALAQVDYGTVLLPSKQLSDALRRRGVYKIDPAYSVPYTFNVAVFKKCISFLSGGEAGGVFKRDSRDLLSTRRSFYYWISDKSAYRHNWKIRPQQSAIFLTDIFFTYDLNMVSIFNKYLPLYYNEAIRKNLTARRMIKKTGRYSPTSMGSGQRKHEGGTDMNGIGIGIISLLVYIAAILVINMVLKRKMAEAMMWSFLIILAMGGIFAGQNVFTLAQTGIKAAAKQEVVYASMAFVFMAFMMDKTGVIGRLVEILNSVLGRLPGGSGYVSTIASALFGMVSGSGSGNASAVGSITIPWMKQSGWSTERATTIVAGNAGLGMIFPPSSSMLLLLGMEAIAAELESNTLYVGLMCTGLVILVYRLFVVFCYAKKDGLKGIRRNR